MRMEPARSRAGTTVLLTMVAVAALAPCLAGTRPLLIVSPRGIELPALREALHLLPRAALDRPAGSSAAPDDGSWVLTPPVEHDPLAIDLEARLTAPGPRHWLGTDELGRDILSRLIHATRPSLLVAAIATFVSLALGIPIGALAGYGGRGVDLVLSRLIEATLSFPILILLLLFAAMSIRSTGGAGGGGEALRSLIVVGGAVGFARWGVIARYMRAEVNRLAGTDLEASARACGAAPLRVVGLHLIPAGLSPVIVSTAFGAGTALVAEASLSFLGMGIQPPLPTWGQMIASAYEHGARYWWLLVFPGAMVALTVGAFNMVGESLKRSGAA